MADLESLKKTPEYKRFQASVEELLKGTDPDAMMREIETIQTRRSVRNMNSIGGQPKLSKIIKFSMEDNALRSRLSFLAISSNRILKALTQYMISIRGWIMTQYRSSMTGSYNDRYAMADTYLAKACQVCQQLETIFENAELAMKDIDQAQWAFKNTVNALELVNRPETQI